MCFHFSCLYFCLSGLFEWCCVTEQSSANQRPVLTNERPVLTNERRLMAECGEWLWQVDRVSGWRGAQARWCRLRLRVLRRSLGVRSEWGESPSSCVTLTTRSVSQCSRSRRMTRWPPTSEIIENHRRISDVRHLRFKIVELKWDVSVKIIFANNDEM